MNFIDEERLAARAARDGRMLDRICHELRRPLAVISGYAEILAENLYGELNADQAASVATIHRTVHGMAETIADLATAFAAMIETPETADRPVSEIVRAEVATLRSSARADRARVVARCDAPVTAVVDESRLRTAFQRLMAHALRHADPAVVVDVRVRSIEGTPTIEVDDPSAMLDMVELENTFAFLHRTGRPSWSDGGAGVDLTLCRTLVESFGGRTRASAIEGQGLRYTIELPAGGPT